MNKEQLASLAKDAMEKAYSPYSNYKVGAALLCKDGSVYTGCNVENASFSATNCAERTAFFKAVSEGKREFAAIAICGGKGGNIEGSFPPCGVCRQVMREFCKDDFEIHLLTKEVIETYTLSQLLPVSFQPDTIKKEDK
ncbi:MAG: cytidine deaminase [Tyzzerella sp.]|nr:cytidine deaminase [Tyzzerella sp.]